MFLFVHLKFAYVTNIWGDSHMALQQNNNNNFVYGQLIVFVNTLSVDSEIVGNLDSSDEELKMPKSDADGRKLTWQKLVQHISSKIMNNPQSTNDCWFVPTDHAGGGATKDNPQRSTSCYATHKLSSKGTGNRWQLHRLTYILKNIHSNNPLEHNSALRLTFKDQSGYATQTLVLHRCHHGAASDLNEPFCINPYHLKTGDAAQNRDDERCANGIKFRCPHKPVCIWTDLHDGHYQTCINNGILPNECACDPPCYL